MTARPLIGFTNEIQERQDQPERPIYVRSQYMADKLSADGAAVVCLPHDLGAVADYVERLDGIAIAGGPFQFPDARLFSDSDNETPSIKRRRYAFEEALIRAALQADKPLLAICGGFQIMNAVLGGTISTSLRSIDPDWAAHSNADEQALVHEISVMPKTRLAALLGEERIRVNSMHQQGVLRKQAGGSIGAVTDDGIVEAIEAPGKRFAIGVQWHPELRVTPQDERLMRAFTAASAGDR